MKKLAIILIIIADRQITPDPVGPSLNPEEKDWDKQHNTIQSDEKGKATFESEKPLSLTGKENKFI